MGSYDWIITPGGAALAGGAITGLVTLLTKRIEDRRAARAADQSGSLEERRTALEERRVSFEGLREICQQLRFDLAAEREARRAAERQVQDQHAEIARMEAALRQAGIPWPPLTR